MLHLAPMLLWLLVAVPFATALLVLVPWTVRARGILMLLSALLELALTIVTLTQGELAVLSGLLHLDALCRPFLLLNAVLFLLAGLYLPFYLAQRRAETTASFCAAFAALQSALMVVVLSGHLGLSWVAVEACTLAAAPLIGTVGSKQSLEALWKYLLVGSVGVALALLGTLHLAYAKHAVSLPASLLFSELQRSAPQLSKPWVQSGIVLLFVGYGTKMGFAPMHTWKPDTYGEAPGVVGIVLAGGVTHCVLLLLLRVLRIGAAAGELAFTQKMLMAFGLLSMLVGAAFVLQQRDLKRMLAYSSIEQVGVLAIGLAVGAVPSVLLHIWCNGLAKAALFSVAGNLHRSYGSKLEGDVRGAIRYTPVSAWILLLGFLAVSGAPPFGTFVSEFGIVAAAMAQGQWALTIAFLALLAMVFMGMGYMVLRCVFGEPPASAPKESETLGNTAPGALALALVLLLGIAVPSSITSILQSASTAWGAP